MKSLSKLIYNLTLNKLPIYRHLINKIKYPKLHVDSSVNLKIQGDFIYENNIIINEGSNIIIPRNSVLNLGNQCYIGRYVELGPSGKIEIGDYSSLQDRCILVGEIEIGRYCLFSLNVLISSGEHYYDKEPSLLIKDQDEMMFNAGICKDQVKIGDDCWIGINSVIMKGVSIGKGCVIGANSVVTKDIPPYCVAVGAPAKVVKKRLEFKPPIEINYHNLIDYPYFYSGFEISALERKQSTLEEGLYAKNKFQVALATQNFKKIYLKAKASIGNKLIRCNGEAQLIDTKINEISFDIPENSTNFIEFTCSEDNKNSKLILQKAWVE